MIKGFFKLMVGILRLRLPIRIWVFWQMFSNMASLFFLQHAEARWTILALIASGAFMSYLTLKTGFTRLLSLGHIFWIPLLVYLVIQSRQIVLGSGFSYYLIILEVTLFISLIFDILDVAKYLTGDKKSLVKFRIH